MKKLIYYYDHPIEEPGSYNYGMTIKKKLTGAGIYFESKHNEDVWEETYIMVKDEDFEKANELIERTPTMS